VVDYSAHLKTSGNSHKVHYTILMGTGITEELQDLIGGTPALRNAIKSGSVAKLVSDNSPPADADDTESTYNWSTPLPHLQPALYTHHPSDHNS